MAKGTRGRRRMASRQYRPTPYPLLSCDRNVSEDQCQKKCSKSSKKKDWEDATCSVCMEFPHNAVLLLCSSHDKGCRPYMCGTSCRYSNCLDQYKKAYTKVSSLHDVQPSHGSVESAGMVQVSSWPVEKCEVTELACPLCRGQVKGWTVVESAREYLNAKKRTCMQDNCSFVGTYKELRKHVRAEHPLARPREVDPVDEQKWRRLERERETQDVISTIQSSMPNAMFFGDYVIEGNHDEFDSDDEEGFDADAAERNGGFMGIDNNDFLNVFVLLSSFGSAGNVGSYRGIRRNERDRNHSRALGGGAVVRFDSESSDGDSDSDDNSDDGGMSLVSRLRRQGRVLLGRSGRRRRHREVDNAGRT